MIICRINSWWSFCFWEACHHNWHFFYSNQGKLFSDSESIQVRAEAALLLKQLDFPVRIDFLFLRLTCCTNCWDKMNFYKLLIFFLWIFTIYGENYLFYVNPFFLAFCGEFWGSTMSQSLSPSPFLRRAITLYYNLWCY